MSHTPGPWQVRHDPGVSRVFRKTKIADVYSEAFRDEETQHANARLIAVTPDLLSELKDVLDWALTERAPLRQQEIDSIRAVIAKAEGK